MFYENWMSYLKDEAKLIDVVMPGSHNAGTYKMIPFAKCQGGSLYEQYKYGVRFFDTRFHISLSGKLVFEHGIMSGSSFEEGLADIRKMMENNDSEFFVFDLHFPKEEYLVPHIGRKYKQDFDLVNKMLEKYIEPSKYALTDYENIADVTMGDIRKSGKRYILNFRDGNINDALDIPLATPWRPDYYGMQVDGFFENSLKFFDEVPHDSLFCYFTQRTPGIGTEAGLHNPITLEKDVKKNFHKLISKIENDPALLARVNIVAGDFMTDSHHKINQLLRLNLKKNLVAKKYEELFLNTTAV